jgi:hypothetical protein
MPAPTSGNKKSTKSLSTTAPLSVPQSDFIRDSEEVTDSW